VKIKPPVAGVYPNKRKIHGMAKNPDPILMLNTAAKA
jgi:hypothetical protein